MQITKPTFVVAELPEPLAAWVRDMRNEFEPQIAHMPAEITLAGSSGVGPIELGQSVDAVQHMLAVALAGRLPFEARFIGVRNFPGSDVFYAAPTPEPFHALHAAIVASGVSFGPSPFSYTAHCSLKGLTSLKPGQREALESAVVPLEPFTISAACVYEIERLVAKRLFTIHG